MPTGANMRVTRARSALRRIMEAEEQLRFVQGDFESLLEIGLAAETVEILELLKQLHAGAAEALDTAKLAVPIVAREI